MVYIIRDKKTDMYYEKNPLTITWSLFLNSKCYFTKEEIKLFKEETPNWDKKYCIYTIVNPKGDGANEEVDNA